MNANKFVDVLLSIVTVALVTTLVLPGRQTANIIKASGGSFGFVLREAQGRR